MASEIAFCTGALFHRCLWSFSSVGSEDNLNHDCLLVLVTGDLHVSIVIFAELYILCAGSP